MKFLLLLRMLVIGTGWLTVSAWAEGLPKQLKMTEATKLEIQRDGKTTGTVALAAGVELEVLALAEEWVKVKFRSLEGRVPVGKTDLIQRMAELTAQAEAAEAAALEAEIKAQAEGKAPPVRAKPAVVRPEPSEMERILAGKLVRLSGSSLKPVGEPELAGVKFYAIYFSASWCGPCRNFTPGFVDAYRELRKNYPEFEAVFVSNDRSAADMLAYMRGDKMAWAAVRFDAVGGLDEINRYAGNGIPCLVLVDANGKVLSDSFRKGNYVGPNTVLNDTTKLLSEYRRKNPRVKS
jgi:nucleoredoxin